MRIFIQFSYYFSEILLIAVELAAGALILREYLRRKNQPHLLFFSIALFVWGLATLLTFLGDLIIAQGQGWLGQQLVGYYSVWVNLGALIFFYGLITIYAKSHRKVWYALVTVAGFLAAALSNKQVILAYGQYLPISTALDFIAGYGFWILANIVTIVAAGRTYLHEKGIKPLGGKEHKMMMYGGLFSVLMAISSVIIIKLNILQAAGVSYSLLSIGTVYKYLGAVAIKNPSEKIRRKPTLIVTGNLNFKVLVVSGMVYVILSLALVSAVTHIFLNRSLETQQAHIFDSLSLSAQQYAERRDSMVMLASMLADHNESTQALLGETSAQDNLLEYATNSDAIDIDLFSDKGTLLASSNQNISNNEYGDLTQLIGDVLAGENIVGTYQLWGTGAWSTLAAVPVRSNGAVSGVIVVSRPLSDWLSSVCISQYGLPISGCGFISNTNDTIAMIGQGVDLTTVNNFRGSLNSSSEKSFSQNDRIGYYYAGSFDSAANRNNEFYYAFITHEDIDKTVLRLMSVAALIAFLLFIMFAFLLSFGVRLFILPILQLHMAAKRMSLGDYSSRIEANTEDEIGNLARSFNMMSETIQHRTDSLNQSMQEQRDFLHHTAQEMRIPLNVFRWSLEMLRFGDLGQLNDEQMELVENMNKTNERVQKLAGQLIDVSRIDRGEVKLNREQIDMADLIDDVAGSTAVRMREKNIDFYWKNPARKIPSVKGDKDILYQVLLGLVDNAIKFTLDGGRVEIKLLRVDDGNNYDEQGQSIMIAVSDNGTGIPSDQQKNIFNRFFRADNAVKKEIEGTGLGLYISKHYIDMHGGRIWFESRAGVGTTFYVTLPTN